MQLADIFWWPHGLLNGCCSGHICGRTSLGLTKTHRYFTRMEVVFEDQEKHTLVSHDRLCFVLNWCCFSLFVLLVLHQSKVVNSILAIVQGVFWKNTTKSQEDRWKDLYASENCVLAQGVSCYKLWGGGFVDISFICFQVPCKHLQLYFG